MNELITEDLKCCGNCITRKYCGVCIVKDCIGAGQEEILEEIPDGFCNRWVFDGIRNIQRYDLLK